MYIKSSRLIREVWKAFKGKQILDSIISEYQIDVNMDFLVVLSRDDLAVSAFMLMYLNLLVKQFEVNKDRIEKQGRPVLRENEKFIILTDDNRLNDDAKFLFPRLTEIIQVSDSEMDCVKKRYVYMPMYSRFIMGSMEINGRCGKDISRFSHISKEEIIARGILGIEKKNYEQWKVPFRDIEKIKNEEIKDCILRLTDKGNKKNEAETCSIIE